MANPNSGPRSSLPSPEVLSSIMAANPYIGQQISQKAAAQSQASLDAASQEAAAASSTSSAAIALTEATTTSFDTSGVSSTSATEQSTPTPLASETGAAQVSQQTTSPGLASSTPSAAGFLTNSGSSTTLATSTVPNAANSNSAASDNASFQASQSLTSLHGTPHPSSSDAAVALPPLSQASHHNGLAPGAVAAAVIVPLLLLLAALAFAFILVRRRNRRNTQVGSGYQQTAMKQRSPLPPPPGTGIPAPVVTNAHNSAYYTGLDTSSSMRSSQGRGPSSEVPAFAASRLSNGGTTFYEPPPAYKKPSSQTSDASPPSYDGRNLPRLSLPTENGENGAFDPFDDPASPTSLHSFMSGASNHLAPGAAGAAAATPSPVAGLLSSPTSPRPGTSRSNTNVSITSDLYSDTASVHSARAARMSVGGAAQVIGANGSQLELGEMPTPGHSRTGSDPFRDPVSPL